MLKTDIVIHKKHSAKGYKMKNKTIVRAGWATKVFPVLALLSFVAIGSAANVNATNPAAVQDTLTVTVDSNCSLTTGGGSYTKSMNPGSTGTITGNTITAVCNDAGGYAIYAIGYSGDSTSGNNTDLISTSNETFNIKTDGSYQESYWKMSFTASGQATVTNPYTAFQQIPATWTKVASYNEYTTSGSIVPHYQIHFGEGQPAGTYTGKVQYVLVNPSGAAAPSTIAAMQNLSASQCTTTPSQVKDTRDGHVYTIQRLKDGKCWMMENLDLGRTAITTDLTSSNTNLATTVTAETFNGWKKTSGSATYDAGEYISVSGTDSTSGTAYGTLYNYYAASAGTISGTSNSNNASYDICPAGWRLPTGGSSGEFQALYAEYNSNALMRASIENSGAAIALAGDFSNAAPARQGSLGFYWSSTRNSVTNMYLLYLNTSLVSPAVSDYRVNGNAIRCVLK